MRYVCVLVPLQCSFSLVAEITDLLKNELSVTLHFDGHFEHSVDYK